MTKREYIVDVAKRAGVPQKVVKTVSDSVFETIIEAFKAGDKVIPYQGFVFSSAWKDPYTMENRLRPGETISVPGKYVPKVKFTKVLKDEINSED